MFDNAQNAVFDATTISPRFDEPQQRFALPAPRVTQQGEMK